MENSIDITSKNNSTNENSTLYRKSLTFIENLFNSSYKYTTTKIIPFTKYTLIKFYDTSKEFLNYSYNSIKSYFRDEKGLEKNQEISFDKEIKKELTSISEEPNQKEGNLNIPEKSDQEDNFLNQDKIFITLIEESNLEESLDNIKYEEEVIENYENDISLIHSEIESSYL